MTTVTRENLPEISLPDLKWKKTKPKTKNPPEIPEPVKEVLTNTSCFVAGGAARRYLHSGPPCNDIDIFCYGNEGYETAKSILSGYTSIVDETDVKVTYTFPSIDVNREIQLIKPINIGTRKLYGNVEEVLGGFDFTVCQAAITHPEKPCIVSSYFSKDVYGARIRFTSTQNLTSFYEESIVSLDLEFLFYRIKKYMDKGFYLTAEEMLKLLPNTWMDSAASRRIVLDTMKCHNSWILTKDHFEYFFQKVLLNHSGDLEYPLSEDTLKYIEEESGKPTLVDILEEEAV